MFTLTIEDQHGGVADEYSFTEGEFIIGRSHSADIVLPSDNVSRRHARLYTVEGRCYVEDLSSSNGVFVNGRRIHEVYQIQRSAQIKVGDYFLHIEGGEGEGAEGRDYGRLLGQNLGATDQVYPIQRNVNLIGRGKDCQVTVIDPSVSRIHSKITVDRGGRIMLEDLKSSNGTFINDERIETAGLADGDMIRFGNVEMRLELSSAPSARHSGAGDDAELDDLEDVANSRTGLWIAIGVVVSLLAVGGIVLAIFGTDLFGGGTAPGVDSAAAAKVAKEDRKSDEPTEADKEAEAKKDKLILLGEKGRSEIAKRKWDDALKTWQTILDLDPLNGEARKAINQTKAWKQDQGAITEAQALTKERLYGKAVKLLRDIDKSSEYYTDAQEELGNLQKLGPSLIQQGDVLLDGKDCKNALRLFQQASQLNPTDASISDRLKTVEKDMSNRRRCKQ